MNRIGNHIRMSTTERNCAVCGDRALGYNFNAITCECCKAFFRRNALSKKQFVCPFNQRCEINMVTRRFCQFCRLRKCFNIGMRKECIMSDEDKELKRQKIRINREKRKLCAVRDANTMTKVARDEESSSPGEAIERYTDTYSSSSSPDNSMTGAAIIRRPSTVSPAEFNINSRIQMMTRRTSTKLNFTSIEYRSAFHPSKSANDQEMQPDKNASARDIVNFIVNNPEQTSSFIDRIMPTSNDAIEVITKILNSQEDAIELVGHLIGKPLDGLIIIGKIMNSPFNAMAVFSKFRNSPTDSLEFIAKVVNSPSEVLQLVRQLMAAPENAEDILGKFMDSPAEALKMLSDMVQATMPNDNQEHHNLQDEMVVDLTVSPSTISPISSPTNYHLPEAHFAQPRVLRINPPPPSYYSRPVLTVTDLDTVIAEAINMEYNGQSKDCTKSRDLNDAESAKLNELIVANKALYMPVDEDLSSLVNDNEPLTKTAHFPIFEQIRKYLLGRERNPEDPQLLSLINLTAFAIKRLIKMAKKINAFKNCCQNDQVALLKGGCTEMMILRSIVQYDIDHSTWRIPQSRERITTVRTDVLKSASNYVHDEYESFIRNFDEKLRKDENVILIMSAIVLFSPNRPMITHSDVLRLEQNSYYYLLRRYLESIYPGCEAKSLYLRMIHKINELKQLKEVIITVYLDANPSQVEPLLREIFDLKNY